MNNILNNLIERANDFLAERPGLLPFIGIGLIALNFLLRLFLGPDHLLTSVDCLLHLGLLISLVGLMLVKVFRE
ncbi:MAG: hypothetical protein KA314_04230 [Chloroflexi bacterium]|nr:hypothetical protein [Chloroflexota bacterium]MBP8055020.1 hypothetical protein [Chloroflexota bacterium]